ncbi:MAG TPA: putative glycoside hydrolase, partial [Bacilli bacterium]
FPENGRRVDQEVVFQNPNHWTKVQAIQHFLQEAKQVLKPIGSFVSADVFGLTTTVNDDMGIGQKWEPIAAEVDYISPMVYPSHYSDGMYGIPHPDLNPYAIVKQAMMDANRKQAQFKKTSMPNQNNQNEATIIRPWFQDFTAAWIHPHKRYGYEEVMAQINAAKEQKVDQYLLWNPHCEYSLR